MMRESEKAQLKSKEKIEWIVFCWISWSKSLYLCRWANITYMLTGLIENQGYLVHDVNILLLCVYCTTYYQTRMYGDSSLYDLHTSITDCKSRVSSIKSLYIVMPSASIMPIWLLKIYWYKIHIYIYISTSEKIMLRLVIRIKTFRSPIIVKFDNNDLHLKYNTAH